MPGETPNSMQASPTQNGTPSREVEALTASADAERVAEVQEDQQKNEADKSTIHLPALQRGN